MSAKTVLAGEDAITLWRHGKEAWNEWVADHPNASVDFSDHHFQSQDQGIVDFSDVQFPNGGVSFSGCNFDNNRSARPSFENARFGNGPVSFSDTRFGDRGVNFDKAHFGRGDVSFDGARFKGEVRFIEAKFNKGDITFHNAYFGLGHRYFDYAKFGIGDVNFFECVFEEGDVSFDYARFGRGDVSFDHVKFGQGDVSFDVTEFNEGTIGFMHAEFEPGNVSFGSAQFTKRTTLRLDNTHFKGRVEFPDLEHVGNIERLSLQGAIFEKSLHISAEEAFGCVLDLTQTKLSNQVTLENVECSLSREGAHFFERKAADRKDAQRFRRLKEIALQNKNYAQAVEFHVGEMQARRWYYKGKAANWSNATLEYFYMLFGDYGRSVAWPLIWLGLLTVSMAMSFAAWATSSVLAWWEKLPTALAFSSSQTFSFVPINVTARKEVAENLFGTGGIPEWAIAIATGQSLLSIVLLFLLGLGLRNRFRV
ncbi:pentapeptide repeat-containing protein [Pontixanthobacter aestiaquae]|uniref:Pentapeptide repeat-containing protein n=1 Tax=Pontixanthobacter aestiaquae TaxID=1509367 RepID=A0A844Z6N0_9SPHN|nr:pentapeptide repeat-containing protein [Pontixanthobacter aestiaquae]MDN3646499.1 pentapeptide repeat-containing protein [Pontixanthobacter aestiaquae]MXO82513.1 hypothetical protein [Pontixanthobacter aestiaquae]